jgi:hypothetical protein
VHLAELPSCVQWVVVHLLVCEAVICTIDAVLTDATDIWQHSVIISSPLGDGRVHADGPLTQPMMLLGLFLNLVCLRLIAHLLWGHATVNAAYDITCRVFGLPYSQRTNSSGLATKHISWPQHYTPSFQTLLNWSKATWASIPS